MALYFVSDTVVNCITTYFMIFVSILSGLQRCLLRKGVQVGIMENLKYLLLNIRIDSPAWMKNELPFDPPARPSSNREGG